MVDEEHGIRNDGSKSSRSHRASEQFIQLIAEKKPTFSHFCTEPHVVGRRGERRTSKDNEKDLNQRNMIESFRERD
jgi:hypothetical protein